MSNHNLSTENPSVLSPPKTANLHLTPKHPPLDTQSQPKTPPPSSSLPPISAKNLDPQKLAEAPLDLRSVPANKELTANQADLHPVQATQELATDQLDPRFKQANKEALVTLGIYGLYFIWWYFFAYYYGDIPVENYEYIFGLPKWFFYSCILGYPIFSVILWIALRIYFKELPLDDTLPYKSETEVTCTPLI